MEKKSNSALTYRHISYAVEESLEYIDNRRKGLEKSLRTGWPKLNYHLLDGIEWYKIFTIVGMSGSGKSIICEQLKRDLVRFNPDEKFDILSFEFEMLAKDQVARSLSGKLDFSTKYLYSGDNNVITDEEYESIVKEAEKMKFYNIFHVDDIGTVEEIEATIKEFAKNRELKTKKRGLIVTIDHVLLTKGKQGEEEKKIVDALMSVVVRLKKLFYKHGIKCLFVLINQLNRKIEDSNRIASPELHYPNRADIFAASSVYHGSDYVIISHKPANIDGIGMYYGPPKGKTYPEGLPLFNPEDKAQAMIYWHVIKQRFGSPKILMMVDEFSNSRVGEYRPANQT